MPFSGRFSMSINLKCQNSDRLDVTSSMPLIIRFIFVFLFFVFVHLVFCFFVVCVVCSSVSGAVVRQEV